VPELVVPDSFWKMARRKDKRLRQAIAKCVELLGDNPGHPGLSVHLMQGHRNVWEAYVDSGNRVTFHWEGETIVLRKNCNHDMLRRP
jgi:hypothetical protein